MLMNVAAYDIATAVASIIVFIVAVLALPAVMPAAYAYLTAIVIFIISMGAGGYFIGQQIR
ncbi:hypothetical protein AZH53_04640 [Methanomicrobiaceae archaeon CYW5]|nr:hypothetical protein [Methanovulcanius yangii]